ncbi:MAG: response regulator [Bermanella sp.]
MDDNLEHIMVVDDTPSNLLLILRSLDTLYRVSCFESGKACLEAIGRDKPHLILMDVCMPEMSGYDCCKIIKKDPQYHDIPIIFLSAHTKLNEKLRAYEIGGADYITKPCDVLEIIAKVDHNLEIMAEFKNRLEQSNEFSKLAMDNIGELGTILHFLENSFTCEDQKSLANLLLASLQAFNLQACVQLRGNETTTNKCVTGPCLPLEVSLMTSTAKGERIQILGKQCICTSKNASILIKDFPIDDEILAGRIRDHLVPILNGASARIDNFNHAKESEVSLVSRIKCALKDIDNTLSQIKDLNEGQLNSILNTLVSQNSSIKEFISDGQDKNWSEKQEQKLLTMANVDQADILKPADNKELVYRYERISGMLGDIISTMD